MTTVLISGWKSGFEKVGFTKFLQTNLGYSLSRAKGTTDAVMDGATVELHVPDDRAEAILSAIDGLGARCGVGVVAR